MPTEFEGEDLHDAVFWGVDLRGARFRDVDLSGARVSQARIVDVEVDALVERLTINGVDVTAYVNEHDRWYPLRAMLRPVDPAGMRAAWDALEAAWSPVIARARQLSDAQRHESVGGEWSFVQTLRHLVFGMDKWFSLPIAGDATFQPIGLPNSGSVDFDWPGLDRSADPTFDEALAAWTARSARFGDWLDALTPPDLLGDVEVLENGTCPRIECYFPVFEESFEHQRYAVRDLDLLADG